MRRIRVSEAREPVARPQPIHETPNRVPQLGCSKGTVVILPEFFDPLPEDLLRAFEGRDEAEE